MEQSENEMMELTAPEEQNDIRDYLLGNLRDEAKMHQIEEKLLLSDDFEEQLSLAADNLIEDYLDGNLSENEHTQFLNFFLSLKENQENLRLIENLRKYASDVKKSKASSASKNLLSQLKSFSSSTGLRFAISAIVTLGLIFGVWRICFYESDVDKGLAQLRLAYQDGRPVEARVTEFGYAPLNEQRGSKEISLETRIALQQIENLLINAAAEKQDARVFQALGKYYLAQKNFEKANQFFEKAAETDSEDANLQSDWGAELLEQGKKARLEKDGAAQMKFINQSLSHLDKAILLDPKLSEPRFNRALSLQILPAPEEAKQAWRGYLEVDGNSQWAKEARQHLKDLESKVPVDPSAAEVEQKFLQAFTQNDEETAWNVLSRNRELIRGKYLPQRLAMSYLEAPDEKKKDFLAALEYAGRLESDRIGDPFAESLTVFYKNLPKDKIETLKAAQNSVRKGYESCLDSKYKEALPEFQTALDLFRQAGDTDEANLTKYFVGYALLNDYRADEAYDQINDVINYTHEHHYKWLETTALYWLAGTIPRNRITESKKLYEKALDQAKEMQDSYAIQRNMMALGNYGSFFGQPQTALRYVQSALQELQTQPEASLRQSSRNYQDAISILIDCGLYDAVKPLAGESVYLADLAGDKPFEMQARNRVAVSYAYSGDFNQARVWLREAKAIADDIADDTTRNRQLGDFFMHSGYVEARSGNFGAAAEAYGEAVRIYQQTDVKKRLFGAKKGQILALQKLGQIDELERQIPEMLRMTEDYRSGIRDEQERISFFDSEENIYDIAADYNFGRGSLEQAYNYAEASSSRTLLDLIQKGVKSSGNDNIKEPLPDDFANPLDIAEIRRRMPDNVQILQYSVLENKVLIWFVSKENFTVKPVTIDADELRKKIENYTALLREKNETLKDEAQELSHEIYRLLIDPIFDQLDPAREICLIPSKSLFSLPFAALLDSDGNPLLARFRLLYAPSANVFLACTKNAQQKSSTEESETVLSVGNPAFNHVEFKDLPDLPSAENEAKKVAEYYQGTAPKILLGADATKTALLATLPNADVIHFAGHYMVAPGAPSASFLLLAPDGTDNLASGILTNAELTDKPLPRAKLVVLSACQTGAETSNGEGLIGLSHTFLKAGAPLVVASQWSVETAPTGILMERFHRFRRLEKMSTTAALRRAQLSMIADSDYSAPYYWAAFAVFGGYSTY